MTWPKHCTTEKELEVYDAAIATAVAGGRSCAPTQCVSALADVICILDSARIKSWVVCKD